MKLQVSNSRFVLELIYSPTVKYFFYIKNQFTNFLFVSIQPLDCVRRQYSKYTIGNPDGDPSKFFRVDGNITLGENIADHGGLKIAEIAYEKWLSKQPKGGRDVILPALEDFT